MTNELLPAKHFIDLRKQIADLQIINKETVFDYESKKGNKEARSHIAKMRKSKTAVTNRHKEKKADARKFGLELDAAKNELLGNIDEMILVHKEPLDRIKEAEEKAEADKQKRWDWVEAMKENERIDEEAKRRAELEAREIELSRKEAEIKAAEDAKLEAERLEKERIENERIQKEREEKIRKDAVEKAEREKIASEAKAKQDKIDAELKLKKAHKTAALAAELAEQKRIDDIKDAEEKAERVKQAEIDRLKREQAEKERLSAEKIAHERAIVEARKADKEHKRTINRVILVAFMKHKVGQENAMMIISDIVDGKIPNISINY